MPLITTIRTVSDRISFGPSLRGIGRLSAGTLRDDGRGGRGPAVKFYLLSVEARTGGHRDSHFHDW